MTTDPGTPRHRRPRFGFRARVLGSFVALVVGAGIAGLLVQRSVLFDRLDRDVDQALERERSELESLAGPSGINPSTGLPFGDDVGAIFETFLRRNVPAEGEVFIGFVDGAYYRSTIGAEPLIDDDEFADAVGGLTISEWGRVDTTAGPVRYLAVPLLFDGETRGVFVAANFLRDERNELDDNLRVSLMVGGVILLAATGLAWFMAGRLLRPIRELTETADRITETDLSGRIPVAGDDEIARLARQFNGMLDRLAGAFAAQRAFVDDAGHELRTPITIVRGELELLGDDPQQRAEAVAIATEELDRMSRIVDDLLTLAKAEQLDFVRREPVEVAELTTDLLVRARTLAGRHWELEACAAGEVQADAQRLMQALLNLVRNAHEHVPHGAGLRLGSRWTSEGLELWVGDDGPGIAADEREHVFERFGRGRDGPRPSEGAGLGLAIVRSIAEAHGGGVRLDTDVGAGSRFTVILPGGAPAEVTEAQDATPWPAHGLTTTRVGDP